MKYKPEDIFTPQGSLEEVEKNPDLDFLMNVFNIPRAFSVSGFGGGWNVGMHSFATAMIALFWANFNEFPRDKKNEFIVAALLHDLHEAATGDILPMFKSKSVKVQLESIQDKIAHSLKISENIELETDLKVVDLIAFLYEIKQVSPSILNERKQHLAHTIMEKQLSILYGFSKEKHIEKEKIEQFLKRLHII